MSEVRQAASSPLARASQITQGLVAVYHFLVATIVTVAVLVDWVTVRSSGDDLIMLKGNDRNSFRPCICHERVGNCEVEKVESNLIPFLELAQRHSSSSDHDKSPDQSSWGC